MRSTKFETFIWLAKLGSFKAVAQRLNLTQPAITQRIAALENELGVQLFIRDSRTVRLTLKGREILPYAEQHIAAVDQILLRCADPSIHFDAVRIGAVETIAHVWLDSFLQRLHRRFPGIRLELMVDSTGILNDYLMSGELDLAFLLGPVSDVKLASQSLCSYSLVWVASADADIPPRMSLEEAAKWPIMTYSRRSLPYRLIEAMFGPLGKGHARISASSSLDTTIRVVKQGRAVTALPNVVAAREIRKGTLKPFELAPILPSLQYVAAYAAGSAHPLTAELVSIANELAIASMQSSFI